MLRKIFAIVRGAAAEHDRFLSGEDLPAICDELWARDGQTSFREFDEYPDAPPRFLSNPTFHVHPERDISACWTSDGEPVRRPLPEELGVLDETAAAAMRPQPFSAVQVFALSSILEIEQTFLRAAEAILIFPMPAPRPEPSPSTGPPPPPPPFGPLGASDPNPAHRSR